MEMIELYCELLLARAAVLDQLAFTDKGAEARNKAKEELNRLNLEKKSASTTSTPEPKKSGGFGWFSSKPSTTIPAQQPQQQPQEPPSTTAAADESDEFNDEANSYINAGLDEAAVAIFYSCPRFPREVKELTTLRLLLMERWGKEFATLAQDNKAAIKIPERLVKKLRVKPPSTELVESYLREIAKAYNVAWPAGEELAEGDVPELMSTDETSPPPGYDDDNDNTGDVAAPPRTPRKSLADNVRRASETDELSRATPPRDIGTHDATGKSPVSVAKPGPSTDNPEPRVRIPGDTEGNKKDGGTRPGGLQRKDSKGIPNVDELSKRFAALKR
jgi:vacuolar protein sorting-associated protein IST1